MFKKMVKLHVLFPQLTVEGFVKVMKKICSKVMSPKDL